MKSQFSIDLQCIMPNLGPVANTIFGLEMQYKLREFLRRKHENSDGLELA